MSPYSELKNASGRSTSFQVLAFLIVADIALAISFITSVALRNNYDIEISTFLNFNNQISLASVWGYSKYVLAIALFYAIYRESRNVGYMFLCGILSFLLLDDAGELHDKVAQALGKYLDFGPLVAMSLQDRGEPLVYITMAAIIAGLLIGAYRRLVDTDRQTFVNFTWAIFLLAVCGAAIDVAWQVWATFTDTSLFGDTMAAAMEDGGELIGVSLLLVIALDRLLFMVFKATAAQTDTARFNA